MNRILAIFGTLLALAICPPVAGSVFALDPLHDQDHVALWVCTALLLAYAWLVVARHATQRPWVAKLTLLSFALLTGELGARVFITRFTDWPHQKLAQLAAATYPDLAAFRGHPFVHFTGRPDRTLKGNAALKATSPFNERGYHGPSVPYEKPGGTCRIVCLGASTTASGYPRLLRGWLADQDPSTPYECVNLAHGFFTSNHSTVSFMLEGIDYDPDYVVIHHGWNDGRARQNAAGFRGDYSHVFKPFEPPRFADWPLIRASVVYRALRFVITGDEGWGSLDASLLQPVDPVQGEDLDRAAQAFERNLRTMIDLALARGIHPVLVTLPHSTDPSVPFAAVRGNIEHLTESMRAVASSYGRRLTLVDLDEEMTGANDWFVDVGHVTEAGREHKAGQIGTAILTHRRR